MIISFVYILGDLIYQKYVVYLMIKKDVDVEDTFIYSRFIPVTTRHSDLRRQSYKVFVYICQNYYFVFLCKNAR